MRFPWVVAMQAVAVCCGIAVQMEASAATRSPNVLFIICDDLCCALGCYGDPTAMSPNIDTLASRGVLFERSYCQYPLCNPSRASLLTGRRPAHTTVRNNSQYFRDANPEGVTLPQAFKQAGWQSERIGKLYHYNVPNQIGTNGMDDPPSWNAVFNPKGRDVADRSKIFSLNPGAFGGTVSWLAADGTDAEQTDGIGAAKAVERLEQFARNSTPFFLAVGFYRPHTPYVAPKPWFQKHPLDGVQLPTVPPDHDTHVPPAALVGRMPEQNRLTGELGKEAVQAYYASVSFVDAQVGIVLESLEKLGLRDNTLIVFTSDHGYHLGEHGLWQKMSLFEESARVPLIIAAPGGRAGVAVKHTVELVDLMPTLCDLAGVPVPKGADGRSLAALLLAPDPTKTPDGASLRFDDRSALTEVITGGRHGMHGMSMRTKRWRYTRWDGGKAGRQLYDHDADSHELTNLADRPEHAATIRELDGEVDRRIEEEFYMAPAERKKAAAIQSHVQ